MKLKYFILIMFLSFVNRIQIYSQNRDLYFKASEFYKLHQLDSATYYIRSSIKNIKNNTDNNVAHNYVLYGKILRLKEQTDSSFLYYQKALDIYEFNKHNDSVIYTYVSLAELFRYRDIPSKANHYLDLAENNINKSTTADIRAYFYNRKAAVEALFFDPLKAIFFSKKVIELKDSIDKKELVLYSLNELGYLYEKKDLKKSFAYYNQALQIANENEFILAKIDVLLVFSRIGDVVQRIHFLEEAYLIAKKIKSEDKLLTISLQLHKAYASLGKYDKAYYYNQQALDLVVKLYDEQNLIKTAEVEQKFNLDKAALELDKKNNEIVANKKVMLLYSIILILLLLLIIIFASFYVKTQRSNSKLKKLSKENLFLLSEANHRINNNLQLILILISEELNTASPQTKLSLQKVLSKIESIATLHRHLYKSPNKHVIDGGAYLKEILSYFIPIFNEHKIKTEFNIGAIEFSNEESLYYGLLVNELCINSLKHAFTADQEKIIQLRIDKNNEELFFLYSDNGKKSNNQHFSPKLIMKMAKQLRIKPVITTNNGFQFSFTKL